MNCQELAQRLLEYVGGELAPEEDALIQGHLDTCRHCVVLLESYRLTIQITRRLPRVAMPDATAERLQAALRAADRTDGMA
jgi:anti-sigma factor RsiW